MTGSIIIFTNKEIVGKIFYFFAEYYIIIKQHESNYC